MKLGIAGAGMIVHSFLPELLETEGLEVAGIYARRLEAAQALCEQYHIALATDSFENLCSSVDTVYVAISNISHYEFCKKALEMGKNVIVEKPMTAHAAQAAELQKLAKERGLFLFEAITTLHMGTYQKIRQWLPRIGQVRNAQSIFTQRSSRLDAFLAGSIAPAFDLSQGGGCLTDLNVYNLHYIMGLFGKPENAVYYPNLQQGVDTSGRIVLEYPGFTAHCYAAKDCGGDHGGLIQGTEGCIRTLLPANQVGKAVLTLRDGMEEVYDDASYQKRACTEFQVYADIIQSGNLSLCYELLEKSLAVSQVMTQVRRNAGIVFPCDPEWDQDQTTT